ncbi:MAG: hypothetical protein AAGF85_09255 [Bacteroidota bacterium]
MRKLISVGDQLKHSFQVKSEDLATFEGVTVHRVCSTFVLAREIEWASRQFVLMTKSDDEEGIGTQLTINHRSPAFLGSTVVITTNLKGFTENQLICTFQSKVGDRIIAEGTTGQKLLKKSRIKEIFSTFEKS